MFYNKKYTEPKIYKKDNEKHPYNIQKGNYYTPLLMDMMTLQQTIGNQEVQRMFKTGELLAKLFVNQPGDVYEQEADRVAQKIVNMGDKEVQLKSEKTKIQKKEPYLGGNSVSSQTEAGIHSLKGNGQLLEPKIRDYFQPRFGVDLGDVRIHTNSNADKLARAIRARAFTLGNDVVFAKGEYKPGTHEGKKLVAHELTHVLQQGEMKINQKQPNIIQRDQQPDSDPPDISDLTQVERMEVFFRIALIPFENNNYHEFCDVILDNSTSELIEYINNHAALFVSWRKNSFSMEGDSSDSTTSPDYTLYRSYLSSLAQGLKDCYLLNSSTAYLGYVNGAVGFFQRAADIYNVDIQIAIDYRRLFFRMVGNSVIILDE